MTDDSRARFTDRADDYLAYRPSYPSTLVDLLASAAGLSPTTRVIDVGAGTGLSSELFLRLGCAVVGVEPNRAMREAGERYLASFARYRAVDGSAEATTLPDRCADLLVAGQAFHWFEVDRARAEAARVLAPGGYAALVWNDRSLDATPFARAYEALLARHCAGYPALRHTATYDGSDGRVGRFLARGFGSKRFDHAQRLDEAGLVGRALSSSYTPAHTAPGRAAFVDELRALFAAYARAGVVEITYDTRVFYGHVSG